MGDLSGQVAIVTGASQGIGRGIAIAFGEAGASVVCTARNVAKLNETCTMVEEAGGKAIAVGCDVRRLADIENCVAEAVKAFGGLNILINNAQTVHNVFMVDATPQSMTDMLDSGPLASYRFMQAAYPHFRAGGGGVVVNVGSPAQHLPVTARYVHYNAAKCSIQGITRAASDEWREFGIYTFMIYPHAETDLVWAMKAREPKRYADTIAAEFPKGRMGDPLEDIGRPMVRLVVNAEKLTGRTIGINSNGVAEIVC